MIIERTQIYLDTSVINFLFADDAPEKRDITKEFFENYVGTLRYQSFVSEFVFFELENTSDREKRQKLLDAVAMYPLESLETTNRLEMQNLAKRYGIVPQKKYIDAYHVAMCVQQRINYLISWNYEHLANIKKEELFRMVSKSNGYETEIRLITPLELMDHES
jgi:predicted nucleic acid-binding protein